MNDIKNDSPEQVRERAIKDLFDKDATPEEQQQGKAEAPGKSAEVRNEEELFRQNIQQGSRGEDRLPKGVDETDPEAEIVPVETVLPTFDHAGEAESVGPIDELSVLDLEGASVEDASSDDDRPVTPNSLRQQPGATEETDLPAGRTSSVGGVSQLDNRPAEPEVASRGSAGEEVVIAGEGDEAAIKQPTSEEALQLAPDSLELSSVSFDENLEPGTVIATLTGHDANILDTLTYEITNDPSGLFELDGDQLILKADAQVDFEQAQSHQITLSVSDDAGNQFTRTFTLEVNDINDAPVIEGDIDLSTDEGAGSLQGNVIATDQDAGALLSFAISDGGSAPAGFNLNSNGSYSFDTTDSAYDHLKVGDSAVLTIPVTVTDDQGATNTTQIQITVRGTNDAPVAGANVTSTIDEGAASISGQLTSSDLDDGATAAFSISDGSSAPAGFSLDANGTYSFDPTDSAYDHLNVGDSAVLTIPVTVTDDQGGTDIAQIQITVQGTNDAPVAGADVTTSLDEDSASISGQLTSTDLDDGATTAFSISEGSSAPAGFSLDANGTYSFDPADAAYEHLGVGDSAVLTIPVTVTDDQGATNTTQIQITVRGTNDAPVAGADVTTSLDEGSASISGQLTSTDL
ncbi:MAG: VCBS domain-containing protein, partial [gamma proteobacterium endosymbiont of Lamellibrachia anaximandri]|nr:VCBS domain-containing protein [gamma proteobacterium endosymbiont of Lamellibrachia anaximandri]